MAVITHDQWFFCACIPPTIGYQLLQPLDSPSLGVNWGRDVLWVVWQWGETIRLPVERLPLKVSEFGWNPVDGLTPIQGG